MWKRSFGLVFGPIAALVILVAMACGCKKSNPTLSASAAASSNTIVRVHWMGKKWLAQDKTATSFMAIWTLPESARLEAQTLDKLALAMAGQKSEVRSHKSEVGDGGTPAPLSQPSSAPLSNQSTPPPNPSNTPTLQYSNSPLSGAAALLRPLLDDLVQEESYLEIRKSKVQSPESKVGKENSNAPSPYPLPKGEGAVAGDAGTPLDFALAIRLSDERAKLWEKNLAEVRSQKSEVGRENSNSPSPYPLPGGEAGQLRKPALNYQLLTINHLAGWTVVGPEHGELAAEILARIERTHTPVAAPKKDYWISADVDLGRMDIPILRDFAIPAGLPRVSLEITGDGKEVRTHAELEFPRPLPLQLESWNIPTNLIHDPLIGFMSMRGIRPWLEAFKPWNDLKLGPAPNQAYFWAQRGPPFLHFMALPSLEASNQVRTLEDFVLNDVNPIMTSNKPSFGRFETTTNSDRLVWHGIPWFSPTLEYVDSPPMIFAGFSPNRLTNRPLPAALLAQIYTSTNLVWYDWEITSPCAEGLSQDAQLERNVFGRAKLTHSASLTWLLAAGPRLGNSVTAIKTTAPTQLSLVRSSSMGFTGMEIQLFMDWLESPEFPRGLHTFSAPPPPPPLRSRRGTNAIPVQK